MNTRDFEKLLEDKLGWQDRSTPGSWNATRNMHVEYGGAIADIDYYVFYLGNGYDTRLPIKTHDRQHSPEIACTRLCDLIHALQMGLQP